MKKLQRKNIFILFIIAILCIWYVVKSHHANLSMSPDAVIVEVATVKQGVIPIQANAIGTLIAAQHVKLTPEIEGHVAKVLFQDGAFVKLGTPLIQLDDAIDKAKLDSAKADLTFSEANYKRMTFLGKRGAISQSAIEQAFAEYTEKKAHVEEYQVTLDKRLLRAPFDGVLGKCKVNIGDHVAVGQELVSLTDTQHLRVEYTVSEKYLSALKIGQAVNISTSAYPGKVFIGKVSFISPTISAEDRTISLYADLSNDQGLLTSGLFVNVTHFLQNQNNALLIPVNSLMSTIDGQQVYKMINDKVSAQPIKIGQRYQDSIQVLEGLKLTDRVVIAGQEKLREGASVKINVDGTHLSS